MIRTINTDLMVLDPTMLEVDLPLSPDSWNGPMTELVEYAPTGLKAEKVDAMCRMAIMSKTKEPLMELNRLDPMLGEAIEHWCVKGAQDKMALIAEWKPLVLELLKSLF
ncbi:unnamed protein product [Clonostachys rosea]|uniref:Uncharacterized protein n=1 Tax=Bionectria ochroleuca TaxID=29856 RepID=A0ABY6U7U0_BIOOC|nr:unnamed protein product [Clonostachys rosea]